MRSFCFFLKIAESHLLCDTFLDLHDPHIWWIPNSRTFWRKYGKNPSHIKNRRIPNHEPELFHAVFSPPPQKKKQIPPEKIRKKKQGFHRQIESSSAAPVAPPLVANFENPMGLPTKSQVSPFPRIVHIPFCQSWQFFSWNFRRNGCEGKGVFSKMCFVSGCGGNTQSEFKAMSITNPSLSK